MTGDEHRSIGAELNNATWDRLASAQPLAQGDDPDGFLYGAYASAFHWMASGQATAAHRARGEHLISRAATAVGRFDVAERHGRRCLELCTANPEVVEDWDFAFAHEAIARALAGAGETERAQQHRATAAELGEAVADEEDREVFLEELNREPWFGLGS
jgi:hypothetical protein